MDGQRYDIVFAVMQYQQTGTILDGLSQVNSPLVVLVGNNMAVKEMGAYILAHTATPKAVLFGFQGTGGRREADRAVCVRFGTMGMTVGGALYRTKTLATGGDCCDFYICKKDSKWDVERKKGGSSC